MEFRNITQFDSNKIIHSLIVDESKQFADKLTCKLCSKILKDPLACSQCVSLFCFDCISNFYYLHKECPFKCFNPCFQEPVDINEITKHVKINCYNKEKGCSEVLEINNIYNHIENNCDFEYKECVKCFKLLKSHQTQKHKCKIDLKETNNSKCEIIKSFSSTLVVNCQFCKIDKKISIEADHTHKCDQYFAGCFICFPKIKNEFINQHTAIECLYQFSLNNKYNHLIERSDNKYDLFSDFKISIELNYSKNKVENNNLKRENLEGTTLKYQL